MKNDPLESFRKSWSTEHNVLRRLLEKDKDTPKAIELFLKHHAAIHNSKLSTGKEFSFQDEVLRDLTEKQMRFQPPGQDNSMVWMLWHITRIEDATMNVLIADKPQVFHRGKWQSKLDSPFVDVGNEMTRAEIKTLSEAINVKSLLAYRLAVGKRTREIARKLQPVDLADKPLPEQLESLVTDGTVREKARWLLKYWGGHPKLNLLLMPASRHCFVHFNEITRMAPKLRKWDGG
jgi:hypothetical protein